MDIAIRRIAQSIALSAGYCVTFLGFRYLSFNQWYLPAGLRAACLLLLPYRWWPAIFAGDIAAMMIQRVPQIDNYGVLWAWLSSFLLIVLVSAYAGIVRKRARNIESIEYWLPFICVGFAIWGSISNFALNFFLNGPTKLVTLPIFHRYVVGDFFGTLMSMLPCLLWINRKAHGELTRKFVRHFILSVSATSVPFTILITADIASEEIQQLLLIMLALPAVYMTVVHGWRGAASGVVISNLSMAQTMTYTGVPGAHNNTVFEVQQAFAIGACVMLIFGSRMSEHLRKSRAADISESQARDLAAGSFESTEPMLENASQIVAEIASRHTANWHEFSSQLRAHGRAHDAMELNRQGMEDVRALEYLSDALYPKRLEEEGLYWVLQSRAFAAHWASNIEIVAGLRRDDRLLSLALQRTAFRCTADAIRALRAGTIRRFLVRSRIWQTRGQRGIVVCIERDPLQQPASSNDEAAIFRKNLNARIKAHGGLMHDRHAGKISFFLSEPCSTSVEH